MNTNGGKDETFAQLPASNAEQPSPYQSIAKLAESTKNYLS